MRINAEQLEMRQKMEPTTERWKQEETSEVLTILRSGRADAARTVGVQTEDRRVREGNDESSEDLGMQDSRC